MKSSSKKLSIILMANDKVGLAIAKYLSDQKENISALVLHSKNTAKLSKEIRRCTQTKEIIYSDQLNDVRIIKRIKNLNPDLLITAWFGYILKKELIDIFPFGCINLHNSYLPFNRGKHPHVWAIYEGTPYGVSIHYIDEHIDSGDIIAQKTITVYPTDTAGTLYEKSIKEIVKLFRSVWPKLKQGKIKPKPQDINLATHHYAKNVELLDFIDLNKKYSARKLIDQIRSRSFSDRTYAYFLHNGKKIFVKILLSNKPNF